MNNSLIKLTRPVFNDIHHAYCCDGGIFHPAEQASSTPHYERTVSLTLTKDLKKKLQTLMKAAANKDIRYYLNGLSFEADCIVATDGHRLLKTDAVDSIEGYDFEKPVIIQTDFLKQLFRFDIWNNNTKLHIDRPMFKSFVHLDDGVFHENLIDGKFPAWRRMFDNSTSPVTFFELTKSNIKDLKDTAKIEKIVNDKFKKHGGVKIKKDGIEFHKSGTIGNFSISTNDPGFVMGVSYKYLCDFPIGQYSTPDPETKLTYASNDGEYNGLIMPMRVK